MRMNKVIIDTMEPEDECNLMTITMDFEDDECFMLELDENINGSWIPESDINKIIKVLQRAKRINKAGVVK